MFTIDGMQCQLQGLQSQTSSLTACKYEILRSEQLIVRLIGLIFVLVFFFPSLCSELFSLHFHQRRCMDFLNMTISVLINCCNSANMLLDVCPTAVTNWTMSLLRMHWILFFIAFHIQQRSSQVQSLTCSNKDSRHCRFWTRLQFPDFSQTSASTKKARWRQRVRRS